MLNCSEILKVNLPEMYSDSPQKQTPTEDFYADTSLETVQRLHDAYRYDLRYTSTIFFTFIIVFFRIFGYETLSFDKVASRTTPEIFQRRTSREIKSKRLHEFILWHLEKEVF